MSEEAKNLFATPTTDILSKVEELLLRRDNLTQLNKELKELKAESVILENELYSSMQEAGLTKLSFKKKSLSLKQENKFYTVLELEAESILWLKKNGFEDIVKEKVGMADLTGVMADMLLDEDIIIKGDDIFFISEDADGEGEKLPFRYFEKKSIQVRKA